MSKPFTLRWFPKQSELHEEGPVEVYVTGGRRNIPVGYVDHCLGTKSLAAADLAAEYWLASSRRERMLGYKDGKGSATQQQADIEAERMKTLEGLAKRPHARYSDYE